MDFFAVSFVVDIEVHNFCLLASMELILDQTAAYSISILITNNLKSIFMILFI